MPYPTGINMKEKILRLVTALLALWAAAKDFIKPKKKETQ